MTADVVNMEVCRIDSTLLGVDWYFGQECEMMVVEKQDR